MATNFANISETRRMMERLIARHQGAARKMEATVGRQIKDKAIKQVAYVLPSVSFMRPGHVTKIDNALHICHKSPVLGDRPVQSVTNIATQFPTI